MSIIDIFFDHLGGGFWEQSPQPQQQPQPGGVSLGGKSKGGPPSGIQQQQQSVNSKPTKENKSKAKRDEMAIMKLFSTAASHNDEFTQWCSAALANMSTVVDIPTFVGFLRDIESPADIHEYVKMCLGETKEALDFARQFIERRQCSGGGGGPMQQHNNTHASNNNNNNNNNSSSAAAQDFQQVKVNRYSLW
ncbi:hypothetical protein AAG570_004870 [Ranatra chinensis]|uniref:Uncharacterized protein n=1 Tax=Ranatra chinensis TaxID=642074 RepID=A0ABD0XYT0_9HEMI